MNSNKNNSINYDNVYDDTCAVFGISELFTSISASTVLFCRVKSLRVLSLSSPNIAPENIMWLLSCPFLSSSVP